MRRLAPYAALLIPLFLTGCGPGFDKPVDCQCTEQRRTEALSRYVEKYEGVTCRCTSRRCLCPPTGGQR